MSKSSDLEYYAFVRGITREDLRREFQCQAIGIGPEERSPAAVINEEALRQLRAIQAIEDCLVERISHRVTAMILERIEDLLGAAISQKPQQEHHKRVLDISTLL